jgi:hypothetical protein
MAARMSSADPAVEDTRTAPERAAAAGAADDAAPEHSQGGALDEPQPSTRRRLRAGAPAPPATVKAPLDAARGEQGMRNARDGFATEHLEIAAYRLIEELARKAGDEQSLAVARQNAQDEERMAQRIDANWAKFVALSMAEEGVA